MAHEIRNPLGGIELYASMLARDVPSEPGSLQLVNKISSGVKRLEGCWSARCCSSPGKFRPNLPAPIWPSSSISAIELAARCAFDQASTAAYLARGR